MCLSSEEIIDSEEHQLQDEHHEEEQRLEEVSLEAGLEVETERDQEEG